MKHIILIVAAILILITSCGGGGGVSGGVGFVPKITTSVALNINDPDSPSTSKSFNNGDKIGFGIKAQDDDKNMEILWVTEYIVSSSSTYEGPTSIQLPKQTSNIITYYPIGSITLSGEPGNYRFELQIEDERGNLSNVSNVLITLE